MAFDWISADAALVAAHGFAGKLLSSNRAQQLHFGNDRFIRLP